MNFIDLLNLEIENLERKIAERESFVKEQIEGLFEMKKALLYLDAQKNIAESQEGKK